MAPIGGGRGSVDGTTVLVISPSAPLGEAMVELEADDMFGSIVPEDSFTTPSRPSGSPTHAHSRH